VAKISVEKLFSGGKTVQGGGKMLAKGPKKSCIT